MTLTRSQIKQLRAEGHRLKLKPVVIIGQKGLSENLHAEIDTALAHHELIKMRIPGLDKSSKKELCDLLCGQHDASLVESIGHVIVLYKRNPETDRYARILKQALS
ncbi:MAG: YhbY family RNA-binding protein [Pseudomonadota bacterium]